jgi:flagellar protein FlaF
MINRDLAECTPGPTRVRALGRNHTLWSTLIQDLSLAENRLPDGIKAQLISLGLWAMRYSTMALLKDLTIEPLIEVNRNVMEGLMAQGNPSAGQIP